MIADFEKCGATLCHRLLIVAPMVVFNSQYTLRIMKQKKLSRVIVNDNDKLPFSHQQAITQHYLLSTTWELFKQKYNYNS